MSIQRETIVIRGRSYSVNTESIAHDMESQGYENWYCYAIDDDGNHVYMNILYTGSEEDMDQVEISDFDWQNARITE